MCLYFIFSRRNSGISSGKEENNYRCNSVLSWVNTLGQAVRLMHTISSNGLVILRPTKHLACFITLRPFLPPISRQGRRLCACSVANVYATGDLIFDKPLLATERPWKVRCF